MAVFVYTTRETLSIEPDLAELMLFLRGPHLIASQSGFVTFLVFALLFAQHSLRCQLLSPHLCLTSGRDLQ